MESANAILRGNNFWAQGYFASTVGRDEIEIVMNIEVNWYA